MVVKMVERLVVCLEAMKVPKMADLKDSKSVEKKAVSKAG